MCAWISANPVTNVLHNILVDKIMKTEHDKSIIGGLLQINYRARAQRVFIRGI